MAGNPKNNKPIMPASMAKHTLTELKSFMRAYLQSRRLDTANAISECLFGHDPMTQGPFMQLSMPYQKAEAAEWPLAEELKQSFDPYTHQLEAYQRLSGTDPKHTLVTTGTGSGKSECFILPVLDYVLKQKKAGNKAGVKALIIYPMNALIDDQGERLAQLANNLNVGLPKDQQIRVGRYTGDQGKHRKMNKYNPSQVIDHREELRQNPPDVLLSNYKMLDYMLFRPEEAAFWSNASSKCFRYLVLDELHTFDGAQGADVACLLRRLRLRLQTKFTCVGTSATIAANASATPEAVAAGKQKLCDFASTLFGEDITTDCIVGEQRVAVTDFLQADHSIELPLQPFESAEKEPSYDEYLKNIAKHFRAPLDPFKRGRWVQKHPLTTQLVQADLRGRSFTQIAAELKIDEHTLVQFLDLLATARLMSGTRVSPVMPLAVHVWVEETGALSRRLHETPQFRRPDPAITIAATTINPQNSAEDGDKGLAHLEARLSALQADEWLPAVHCQRCGISGWAAKLEVCPLEPDEFFVRGGVEAREALSREGAAILFKVSDSVVQKSGEERWLYHYDLERKKIGTGSSPSRDDGSRINLHLVEQKSSPGYINWGRGNNKAQYQGKCPSCESRLSLRRTSMGGSMLGSVLTGSFLSSWANPDDRKLLIFNDSVQDAAHQAGYIGARSFRFHIRRIILECFQATASSLTQKDLKVSDYTSTCNAMRSYLKSMWDVARQDSGQRQRGRDAGVKSGFKTDADIAQAKRRLMQCIPLDLWQSWKARSSSVSPFGVQANFAELASRLSWEIWSEILLQADLGWSLRKTGLMSARIKPAISESWGALALKTLISQQRTFGENDLLNNGADMQRFADMLATGFGMRLQIQGAVYQPDLEAGYEAKNFSLFRLLQSKPYLKALFGSKHKRPSVLDVERNSKRPGYCSSFSLVATNVNWFSRWYADSIQCAFDIQLSEDQRKKQYKYAKEFWDGFVKKVLAHGAGLQWTRPNPGDEVKSAVLSVDAWQLVGKGGVNAYDCKSCGHMQSVSSAFKHTSIPCSQHLCKGVSYQRESAQKTDLFRDYLREYYLRDGEPPYPHAHTGQLDGDTRRTVEAAFKQNLLPGDVPTKSGIEDGGSAGISRQKTYLDHPVNVLACTPTMEMGIDIGSLSGVMLRGFPPTLANTLQRLGRGGRSSGNSFNMILTRRRSSHDRHHWVSPDRVFRGSVEAPGCEFRTRDILRRQFHASLLDHFVSQTHAEFPSFPRAAEQDGELTRTLPFWKSFRAYLDGCHTRVGAFLTEVQRGDKAVDTDFYQDMQVVLTQSIGVDGYFWRKLSQILDGEDSKKNGLKEGLQSIHLAQQVVNKEQGSTGLQDQNSYDHAEQDLSNLLDVQTQREHKKRTHQKYLQTEHILSVLSDAGLLPNYAFPRSGVELQYSVAVKRRVHATDVAEQGRPQKYDTKYANLQRPPAQALKEFAPGGAFYLSQFKVPITRIVKPGDKDQLAKMHRRSVICSACAGVTETESKDRKLICPECNSEDQDVRDILYFEQVQGGGQFEDLQIRDQEERRQSTGFRRETMVQFSKVASQETEDPESFATWKAPNHPIAFEFRNKAKIQYVMRGEHDAKYSYKYFSVCRYCWAIPYDVVSEKKGAQFSRKGQPSRHAADCEKRAFESLAGSDLLEVALGHEFESDSIRFYAEDSEFMPSLRALLQLALKIRLGGQPSHIATTATLLHERDSGIRNIITLYDRVPGGSGHLTSLMPKVSEAGELRSTSGLRQLRGLLQKTLDHIHACDCENGCYHCLLSKANEFDHKDIVKDRAIGWLDRFLQVEESEWVLDERSLNAVVVDHDFDSRLEHKFAEALMHVVPGIYGLERGVQPHGQEPKVIEFQSAKQKEFCKVVYTSEVRVPVGKAYTKPDFHLIRDDKNVGYLYLDGSRHHLDPGLDVSTFEDTDFGLRSQLAAQYKGVPVLVYSYDMIDAFATWVREGRTKSNNYFDCSNEFAHERPRALLKYGAKKAPILAAYLVQKFASGTDLAKKFSIFAGVDDDNLHVSFVASTLAESFGTGSAFLTPAEYKATKTVISHICDATNQELRRFGGLTLRSNGKKFVFAMDASLVRRCDGGRIDRLFKRSWELFWILWHINPDWVEMQETQILKSA